MSADAVAVAPARIPGSSLIVPRLARAQRRALPFLSVVVPTYNESANIGPFLKALRAGLDSACARYEVIVVDDESPDGTGDIVHAISTGWPNLRLVERRGERGLARAVVYGWQNSDGDVLATINADFQHPPHIIAEMFRKIEDVDLVVATRYAAQGSVGSFPVHRQILSSFARNVGALLIPGVFARVSDPLSGCYMLRRQAIEEIELRPAGFKTLIEVLARGRVRSVAEHGYTMAKRRNGRSNVRLRDWIEYIGQLNRMRGEVRGQRR